MLKLRPFSDQIVELQAARIVGKLGGVARLAASLKAQGLPGSEALVRRWLRPIGTHGGTGGLIPHKNREDVRLVAKLEGIELAAQDWWVETRRYIETVEDGVGWVVPDPVQEKRMIADTIAREKEALRCERERLDPHGLKYQPGRWSLYKRWQGLPSSE